MFKNWGKLIISRKTLAHGTIVSKYSSVRERYGVF
jgi:hypothetical protein